MIENQEFQKALDLIDELVASFRPFPSSWEELVGDETAVEIMEFMARHRPNDWADVWADHQADSE
ncbi:MAG: hypothetical protein H0V90_07075 [Blastocatellia bacterium]|nr:hypothetical protein [Blastocatellia bacterium]